ncbi:DUF1918 domain-containing protein [Cellulosimicrobium cellulans]|uniref:DUF1918 domain-containing protein n=1 Tax=Cellulosimicrobium cellulans TaxID=1710 RepID=A0A4Y4DUV5_CELCE|nr:DUF1918 domain-containing protein [Cellulosimicrobium cellulans]GED08427.1 hypothetical protein CCE02nite_04260 [Cellulosimicrobium cellulans]
MRRPRSRADGAAAVPRRHPDGAEGLYRTPAHPLTLRGRRPTTESSPPFLVRWSDDGYVTLFFPGPDTVVHDGTGDDVAADTTARTPA